jgi:outer membrane protein assembly factor BamB
LPPASLLAAALSLSCGGSNGVAPSSAAGAAAAPVTNPLLLATASDEWAMYGHDLQRTNCNTAETRISAASVSRLAPAWEFDGGTNGKATSSAPVVTGGRVYVGSSVDHGDNYFALDAPSGGLLWSANVGHGGTRLFEPCGSVGVGSTAAVMPGLLAVGGGDAAYYGLDPLTGAMLWRHDLDAVPGGFAWASPLLANGKVYVGVASACTDPVRGEIRALDPASGALLAEQFFVPPGTGGASLWNSPTLTPDGTSVIVATGNDDGTHGLYEQAVVSLDAQTLSFLQANKQGPTDLDLDFVSTPIVFSDATGRVLVGASQKTGIFYAYEAAKIGAGPIWSRTVGAVIGLAPAYGPSAGSGGTLFFGGTDSTGNDQVHAVDPATGNDRWPPLTVGVTHGNLAVANGLLFVNSGPDGLRIFDANTGTALRVLVPTTPGNAYSGVSVSGGTVYWLSGSVLNAWRAP